MAYLSKIGNRSIEEYQVFSFWACQWSGSVIFSPIPFSVVLRHWGVSDRARGLSVGDVGTRYEAALSRVYLFKVGMFCRVGT